MGFKLVRKDVVERSKIPLQVGSHIIGRDDSLLNCGDQRVSRNHAVIKVSDDTVILESLHHNPCFYSKLCLTKPLVLNKGEWVSLSSTDNFGLLPDSYWYELIFCDNTPILKNPETVEPEMKVNDGGSHQVTYTTEENINPSVMPDLPQTNPENVVESDSDTLNLEFDEMEGDESQSLIINNPQLEKANTSPNNRTFRTKFEDTNCDDQTITSKRSHTPENSSNAKKVKKEPESPNKIDDPIQSYGTEEAQPVLLQNPAANINTQTHIDAHMEPQNSVTHVNYVNAPPTNPTEISPVLHSDLMLTRYLLSKETEDSQAPRNVNPDSESSYEADTNADLNPDELEPQNNASADVKKEQLTPNDKKNISETEESQAPRNVNPESESSYEAETNPEPNPDELEPQNHASAKVKKEPLTPNDKKNISETRNDDTHSESAYEADTNADPISDELEPQNHASAEAKKEPVTPDDKKNILENVAMPGSSHDGPGCSNDVDSGAGGGAAKQPDRPRERCLYGANCYRRNPQHKEQFSHPCDRDYGPGATGRCPYGASCRRADPRHWRIHDHPGGTVPPLPRQQGNPVRKRQKKVVRQPSASDESDRDSPSPDLILDGKRKRKTIRERCSDSEEEQDPYATDESDDWKPGSDDNKM